MITSTRNIMYMFFFMRTFVIITHTRMVTDYHGNDQIPNLTKINDIVVTTIISKIIATNNCLSL